MGHVIRPMSSIGKNLLLYYVCCGICSFIRNNCVANTLLVNEAVDKFMDGRTRSVIGMKCNSIYTTYFGSFENNCSSMV